MKVATRSALFLLPLSLAACMEAPRDGGAPPLASGGQAADLGAPASGGGGIASSGGGGTASSGGASSGGSGGASTGGSGGSGGGVGAAASGGASIATGGADPLGSGGAGSGSGGGGVAAGGTPAVYDPCPQPPEPCKVMPSGDSITVGAQSTDTGGYRVPLFLLARESGKTFTFVGPSGAGPETVDGVPFPDAHDGHSGYVIDTIDTRKGLLPLVAQNVANFSPHIVLLMIGTNDLNSELEVDTAPDRLAEVVDAFTQGAPQALLVLAQLIPTRTDTLNAEVEAFNAELPELVASRVAQGKHVLLVDMYSAFTENPSYKDELLFDGLHPNDAGYAVMADTWFDAVASYLH